jgi:hypothetical protein
VFATARAWCAESWLSSARFGIVPGRASYLNQQVEKNDAALSGLYLADHTALCARVAAPGGLLHILNWAPFSIAVMEVVRVECAE